VGALTPGCVLCVHVPAAVDFEMLVQRKIAAPWKPPIKDICDTSNFDPVRVLVCCVCVVVAGLTALRLVLQYDEDDYCPPFRDDGSGWDADF
jgi:hypothetical protein